MILTFKKRFIEPILNGIKIHTIRLDPHNRWKIGMQIQMYSGSRFSKDYKKFNDAECMNVQKIEINYNGIYIDNMKPLTEVNDQIELFINDGFVSAQEFHKFFNYRLRRGSWIPFSLIEAVNSFSLSSDSLVIFASIVCYD